MTSQAEKVLLALTDLDTLARRFAAGDTTEIVLLALLRHPSVEVRDAVVVSPAATAAVLTRAASDAMRHIREAVASRPQTPPHILETLADDTDPAVVAAVAGNTSTPAPVVDRLADHRLGSVRTAAAGNRIDPDRIERLATDRAPFVRAMIAGRSNLPLAIRERLVVDPDENVRQCLAERCEHTDVLVRLAVDTALVARAVAASPHADATVLLVAARHGDVSVRQTLARRHDLTDEVTAVLLDDGWQVRIELAANERTSPEVLARLTGDPSTRVRRATITNPSIAAGALHSVLSSPDLDDRRRARTALTRRGVTPPMCDSVPNHGDDLAAVLAWVEQTDRFDDLAAFVADTGWPIFARRTALLRVPLPEVVFEAAASAEVVSIRRAAAEHRLCPTPILERLAADRAEIVRRTVAERHTRTTH